MLMQNPLNESASGFPVLECIHLVGIVCGVGTAALVNFRLLGVGLNRSSPAELWKAALPWTLSGLTVAIFSGLLLFSIDPEKYWVNPAFRFKMLCLLLAILFHFTAARRAAEIGRGPIFAGISLGLWTLPPLGGVLIGLIDSSTNVWSYVYPVFLWLHVIALVFLGGMIVATDLRMLGLGMGGSSISEFAAALRIPKRFGFLIAAAAGVALFADKSGHAAYVYHRWFWIKLALLVLAGANYFAFRRGVFAGKTTGRPRLAAGASLFLCAGMLGAARGPATIKDIMRSMVDPSGDYLFQSVQTIADERGIREKAPTTDAGWEEVRERVEVLLKAPHLLAAPGRVAAQPKDRSKNPAVENEPWEIQQLLDGGHPEFVRRAQRLQNAASIAMKAVEAKDKNALLAALSGIDKACESCHLRYWYPKDQRAREAAKQDGVIE